MVPPGCLLSRRTETMSEEPQTKPRKRVGYPIIIGTMVCFGALLIVTSSFSSFFTRRLKTPIGFVPLRRRTRVMATTSQ